MELSRTVRLVNTSVQDVETHGNTADGGIDGQTGHNLSEGECGEQQLANYGECVHPWLAQGVAVP